MAHFTDEQVMMFVDGEAGADVERMIRGSLERDRDLKHRVTVFTQSRRAMKVAFKAKLSEKPPAQLAALFGSASPRSSRPPRGYAYLLGLAASAVLGLGLSFGYHAYRSPRSGLPAPALISAALEATPSGIPFANNEGTIRYEITPIKTVRTGDGTWCREFDAAQVSREDSSRMRALACREAPERWTIQAILTEAVTRHESYSLASGSAGSMTATPVSIDQELQVIQSHWK